NPNKNRIQHGHKQQRVRAIRPGKSPGELRAMRIASWASSQLPAPTEVSVNVDESQELIQLSLCQAQFGVESIRFIGEHLQVVGGATAVAQLGKPGGILGRKHELLLMLPVLTTFLISNQRVRYSPKSLLTDLTFWPEQEFGVWKLI